MSPIVSSSLWHLSEQMGFVGHKNEGGEHIRLILLPIKDSESQTTQKPPRQIIKRNKLYDHL